MSVSDIFLKKNIEYWVNRGILDYDKIALSESKVLMSKILDNVHKHKITRTSDGRWVTSVPDPTKPTGLRQIRRKSKSELYAHLIEFYGLLPEHSSVMTIGEVFLEWIEYKREFTKATYKPLSPSTIRRYELDYKKFIENTELRTASIDIDDLTLEQHLIRIVSASKMAPRTFGNLYGYLSQMFRFAIRKRYIVSDPITFVDKNRIMSFCCAAPPKKDSERVISSDDLHKLLNAIHTHLETNPNYMPDYAILLATLTGMRVGEIVALKWECIDEDFIHVDYSEHRYDYGDHSEVVIGEPKSHKHRLVPVTKDISELLAIVRSHNADDTWVFADDEGRVTEKKSATPATDDPAKQESSRQAFTRSGVRSLRI